MQNIRVIQIPQLKAVTSGKITTMEQMEKFDKWWSSIDTTDYITPRDFMWFVSNENYIEWIFAIPRGLDDFGGYKQIDFSGGLYAVATVKDADCDGGIDDEQTCEIIRNWVLESDCFALSTVENDLKERYKMNHIITPKIFKEKMGYHLSDVFVPIVLKNENNKKGEHFMNNMITINTSDWVNSPYVPKSNAKIKSVEDYDGNNKECWYIDSVGGKWSTLIHTIDVIRKGETVELAFWAKFGKTNGGITLMTEVCQGGDWDERTSFSLSKNCTYTVGNNNGWYLFSVPYTSKCEDPLLVTVSVNNLELTIFSANESDLKILEETEPVPGMISVIHRVVTPSLGQNYAFGGCMAYLAECLKLDRTIFDYWHFTMATGDSLTQIHCDDNTCTDGITDKLFDKEIAEKAFAAMGYDCTYFSGDEVKADKDRVFELIINSIDKGIPVISKGLEGDDGYDFCVICGYDKDNKTLKIMFRENDTPIEQKNLLDCTSALMFATNKIKEINIKQFYSDIIKSISYCISRPAERGVTFGKDAFNAWANSLIDGTIASIPDANSWMHFGYNLCIVGTNAYAGSPMARDILKKCPDFEDMPIFEILKKVAVQFNEQDRIFKELLEMGYGFEIPSEKLRDIDFMRPAADKIREFCNVCDNISAIFTDEILNDEDIWDCSDNRIINKYKQAIPKSRFIGIKYGDEDRVDGSFGNKWNSWFETEKFAQLEKLLTEDFKEVYTDTDAYIGLMRHKDDEPFEYWIGIFLPENTDVPEGFSYIDFNTSNLGVCWIKGKEENVFGAEGECAGHLINEGMKITNDENDACWFFERYVCPRYTTPDEFKRIILDICFFVE